MFTLHAYDVDQFGDLAIECLRETKTALKQWMISVVINQITQRWDGSPLTEIHHALDRYLGAAIYNMSEEYIRKVEQTMLDYYLYVFDFFCPHNIIDCDFTSEYNRGAFVIIKD